jgi:hypothetical protein
VPFGIEKDGFWGVKELSYQHVHLFWAFWAGYIAFHVSGLLWSPVLCGFCCGVAMETYQNFESIKIGVIPKSWLDVIRDLCFWTLGGCLNYILIFVDGATW